jgi:hypothetical protein
MLVGRHSYYLSHLASPPPIFKNAKIRAGGVAQAVDCPPSKRKTLSSNPSIDILEGGKGRKGEGKKEGRREVCQAT